MADPFVLPGQVALFDDAARHGVRVVELHELDEHPGTSSTSARCLECGAEDDYLLDRRECSHPRVAPVRRVGAR